MARPNGLLIAIVNALPSSPVLSERNTAVKSMLPPNTDVAVLSSDDDRLLSFGGSRKPGTVNADVGPEPKEAGEKKAPIEACAAFPLSHWIQGRFPITLELTSLPHVFGPTMPSTTSPLFL